ncbi:MAG: hypothetical protein ACREFE_17190, partial [Limisphaerales bacterium]
MAQDVESRQRPPCMMRRLKSLLNFPRFILQAHTANQMIPETRKLLHLFGIRSDGVDRKSARQAFGNSKNCLGPFCPLRLEIANVRWICTHEPIHLPLRIDFFCFGRRTALRERIAVAHAATSMQKSGQLWQLLTTVKKQVAAKQVVHVECSNTLFRRAYEFAESSKRISIPAENLNDAVEVNVFVRAQRDASGYSVDAAHSDYDGAKFQIQEGDILA